MSIIDGPDEETGIGTARIIFAEDVSEIAEDYFYSSEDDNFSLGEEYSNEFGYDDVSIISDDYLYNWPDQTFIYGYVDVQVICTGPL